MRSFLRLPQTDQGKRPGGLHKPQGQQRRAFVPLQQSVRHARPLHHELRAKSTEERRDRNESNSRENDVAASPQVAVFSKKGDEEQAKPNNRPNNRKMIQQKMQVCIIHIRLPSLDKLSWPSHPALCGQSSDASWFTIPIDDRRVHI